MKAKKMRKIAKEQMESAMKDNVKLAHAAFCRLHWKERMRIAWLLVKGDSDLEKAVR